MTPEQIAELKNLVSKIQSILNASPEKGNAMMGEPEEAGMGQKMAARMGSLE